MGNSCCRPENLNKGSNMPVVRKKSTAGNLDPENPDAPDEHTARINPSLNDQI